MKIGTAKLISVSVSLCAIGAALYVLTRVLHDARMGAIVQNLAAARPYAVAGAVALTALNYAILIGYDFFSLKAVGCAVPFRTVAFTSFVGDTVNANVGLSVITGSFVKCRMYTAAGCRLRDVIRAISYYTAAYWAGFCLLSSFFVFAQRSIATSMLHAGPAAIWIRVVVPALVPAVFVAASALKKHFRIGRLRIDFPPPMHAAALLATAVADWFCSLTVLWLLVPKSEPLSLGAFGAAYLFAHLLGHASQAPGGIVVFEAALLASAQAARIEALAAALLFYRLIFYACPFAAAMLLFAVSKHGRFAGKARKRPALDRAVAPVKDPPLISVVIAAYNEEYSLGACIESLKKQTYPGGCEVIVVDNASTDATAAIARRAGCRVVEEPERGYVNALSAGFSAARGDIIACTDADSVVEPDWLDRIYRTLSRPGVGGCSGGFRFHDGPWWIRLLGLFGRLNWHLAGANMAVWRHAFEKAGGFRRDVNMGADVDLGLRMKQSSRVVIDRTNIVSTSSRRFQCAFWETVLHYYANDLCLLVFRRPLFFGFRDYRISRLGPASLVRPAAAFAGLLLVSILVGAWTVERPTSQILGHVFNHGARDERLVALTFDDGPGQSTDTILAVLKRYDAHATFFMVGHNVEHNAALLQKLRGAGHEIGNHTYSHPVRSVVQTAQGLRTELSRTADAIEGATGVRTTLFRPPHGWRSPWMLREVKKSGMTSVLWSIDSRDWAHLPARAIVTRVARKARPGAIILFHDRLGTGKDRMMRNTVAALPSVLEMLQKQGYRFVTVSEMMAHTGATGDKAALE